MARTLNEIMSFDHVIEVHEDGTITEPRDAWGPELCALSTADGSHTSETDPDLIRSARWQGGWELETGWTGQHGYSGPCMHQSECIGGGLEAHIRATPGQWVVVVIGEDVGEPECWAVAHRPVPVALTPADASALMRLGTTDTAP